MSNPMPTNPRAAPTTGDARWAPPTEPRAPQPAAPAPASNAAARTASAGPPQPYAAPPGDDGGANPYSLLEAPAPADPRADDATSYPMPVEPMAVPYANISAPSPNTQPMPGSYAPSHPGGSARTVHYPQSPAAAPGPQAAPIPPSVPQSAGRPARPPAAPMQGPPGSLVNASAASVHRPGPMPAQRTSALRRFGLIVFVFCLVCVLVIVFIALMFHRPESDDPHGITAHSSGKPTFPQIGYAGTATLTGRPASQWTAGVSAAWRIPQLNDDQHSSQVFGVHGDQLAVIDRTDSFEPVLSVYDISGAQPKLQWEKRGEHVYAIHGDTIAWWGDYIVTSDKVFDARTGEQLGDPLPAYGEFTVVGDILISRTYDGHCVGWRTPTETLWEETLGVDATLTTLSTSDGTDRWLLLRGAGQEKQWVLNASTGTTSQLMKSIPIVYTGERGPLIVAEDGWVAVEDVTRKATFMSANGTVVDTVTSTEKLFRAGQYPVLDGKRPTIAQLTAFARSGDVSWAEQSYSFTGKNCEYFRIGQRKALVPDGLFLSIGFEDDCHSYLGSVTTAADGSVAMTYQDDFNDRLVMFDMFTGKLLDTSTFGDLENSILAYDDLVLAKSDQGILGLTPTH